MKDAEFAGMIERNLQGPESQRQMQGLSMIVSEFFVVYVYGEREDEDFDTAYRLQNNTRIKDKTAAEAIAARGKAIIEGIKKSVQEMRQAEDAKDATSATEKARVALAAVVSEQRAKRLGYLRSSLDRAERAQNTAYIETLNDAIDSLKRDAEWALKLGVVIESTDAERLRKAVGVLEKAAERMKGYGFDTGYISGLLSEFSETAEKLIARSATLANERKAVAEKAAAEEAKQTRDDAQKEMAGIEDEEELVRLFNNLKSAFSAGPLEIAPAEALKLDARFEAATAELLNRGLLEMADVTAAELQAGDIIYISVYLGGELYNRRPSVFAGTSAASGLEPVHYNYRIVGVINGAGRRSTSYFTDDDLSREKYQSFQVARLTLKERAPAEAVQAEAERKAAAEKAAAEEAAKAATAAQGGFESVFGGRERAGEVLEFLGFERSAGIVSYSVRALGAKPHISEHVLKVATKDGEREVRFFTKDLPRESVEKENRIGEAAFRAGVGPKCTMLTDAQGKTTLLQMTPQGIDLRTFKAQVGFKDKNSAQDFVRMVANALGRLHGAGYTHEDLAGMEGLRGSHIFVELDTGNNITGVRFIDFGIGQEGTDSNKVREKAGVLSACVDTVINMAGLDIADAMKLVKDVFDGEYGKGLIEGESSVPAAEVARRNEEKARAAREAEEAEVKRKAEAVKLAAERQRAAEEAAKAVTPQVAPIDADFAAAQKEAATFGLDTAGTAADVRSRVRDRLVQFKNDSTRLFLDNKIPEALAQLEETRKLDFKSRQNYRDIYTELLTVTMYIENYREIIKALEVADTLSAKDLAVMLNQLAEIESNVMKLDPAASVLVKILTVHHSVLMKIASAANARTGTIELNIILDSLVQLGNNLIGLKGVDLGAAIENTNSAFVHVCRLLLEKFKVKADFDTLAEKIRSYQTLDTEARDELQRDITIKIYNLSQLGPGGTLKAPGKDMTDEDRVNLGAEAERLITNNLLDAVSTSDVALQDAASVLSRLGISIPAGSYIVETTEAYGDSLKVDGKTYVLGYKDVAGKLHIIVTGKFFREVLSKNAAMLAETIDHEYTENMLTKADGTSYTHREAAERARLFKDLSAGKAISPFHEWYLDQLAAAKDIAGLNAFKLEARTGVTGDIKDYEDAFLAKADQLAKLLTEQAAQAPPFVLMPKLAASGEGKRAEDTLSVIAALAQSKDPAERAAYRDKLRQRAGLASSVETLLQSDDGRESIIKAYLDGGSEIRSIIGYILESCLREDKDSALYQDAISLAKDIAYRLSEKYESERQSLESEIYSLLDQGDSQTDPLDLASQERRSAEIDKTLRDAAEALSSVLRLLESLVRKGLAEEDDFADASTELKNTELEITKTLDLCRDKLRSRTIEIRQSVDWMAVNTINEGLTVTISVDIGPADFQRLTYVRVTGKEITRYRHYQNDARIRASMEMSRTLDSIGKAASSYAKRWFDSKELKEIEGTLYVRALEWLEVLKAAGAVTDDEYTKTKIAIEKAGAKKERLPLKDGVAANLIDTLKRATQIAIMRPGANMRAIELISQYAGSAIFEINKALNPPPVSKNVIKVGAEEVLQAAKDYIGALKGALNDKDLAKVIASNYKDEAIGLIGQIEKELAKSAPDDSVVQNLKTSLKNVIRQAFFGQEVQADSKKKLEGILSLEDALSSDSRLQVVTRESIVEVLSALGIRDPIEQNACLHVLEKRDRDDQIELLAEELAQYMAASYKYTEGGRVEYRHYIDGRYLESVFGSKAAKDILAKLKPAIAFGPLICGKVEAIEKKLQGKHFGDKKARNEMAAWYQLSAMITADIVPFTEQILAGFYMADGFFVDISTGAGKTHAFPVPNILDRALGKKSMHLVTTDNLIARDFRETNLLYKMMGFKVTYQTGEDRELPDNVKRLNNNDIVITSYGALSFTCLYAIMDSKRPGSAEWFELLKNTRLTFDECDVSPYLADFIIAAPQDRLSLPEFMKKYIMVKTAAEMFQNDDIKAIAYAMEDNLASVKPGDAELAAQLDKLTRMLGLRSDQVEIDQKGQLYIDGKYYSKDTLGKGVVDLKTGSAVSGLEADFELRYDAKSGSFVVRRIEWAGGKDRDGKDIVEDAGGIRADYALGRADGGRKTMRDVVANMTAQVASLRGVMPDAMVDSMEKDVKEGSAEWWSEFLDCVQAMYIDKEGVNYKRKWVEKREAKPVLLEVSKDKVDIRTQDGKAVPDITAELIGGSLQLSYKGSAIEGLINDDFFVRIDEDGRQVGKSDQDLILKVGDKTYIVRKGLPDNPQGGYQLFEASVEIELIDADTGRTLAGQRRDRFHTLYEIISQMMDMENPDIRGDNRSTELLSFPDVAGFFFGYGGASGSVATVADLMAVIFPKTKGVVMPCDPAFSKKAPSATRYSYLATRSQKMAINRIRDIYTSSPGASILVYFDDMSVAKEFKVELDKAIVEMNMSDTAGDKIKVQIFDEDVTDEDWLVNEAGKRGTITLTDSKLGRATNVRLAEAVGLQISKTETELAKHLARDGWSAEGIEKAKTSLREAITGNGGLFFIGDYGKRSAKKKEIEALMSSWGLAEGSRVWEMVKHKFFDGLFLIDLSPDRSLQQMVQKFGRNRRQGDIGFVDSFYSFREGGRFYTMVEQLYMHETREDMKEASKKKFREFRDNIEAITALERSVIGEDGHFTELNADSKDFKRWCELQNYFSDLLQTVRIETQKRRDAEMVRKFESGRKLQEKLDMIRKTLPTEFSDWIKKNPANAGAFFAERVEDLLNIYFHHDRIKKTDSGVATLDT